MFLTNVTLEHTHTQSANNDKARKSRTTRSLYNNEMRKKNVYRLESFSTMLWSTFKHNCYGLIRALCSVWFLFLSLCFFLPLLSFFNLLCVVVLQIKCRLNEFSELCGVIFDSFIFNPKNSKEPHFFHSKENKKFYKTLAKQLFVRTIKAQLYS